MPKYNHKPRGQKSVSYLPYAEGAGSHSYITTLLCRTFWRGPIFTPGCFVLIPIYVVFRSMAFKKKWNKIEHLLNIWFAVLIPLAILTGCSVKTMHEYFTIFFCCPSIGSSHKEDLKQIKKMTSVGHTPKRLKATRGIFYDDVQMRTNIYFWTKCVVFSPVDDKSRY